MHLDHLERIAKKNKPLNNPISGIFKELKTLVVIFAIVFVVMLIFTNINLFANSLSVNFKNIKNENIPNYNNTKQDNSISTIIDINETKLNEIQKLIEEYSTGGQIQQAISTSIESILQSKLKKYEFDFNTLPPSNRLIINSLGMDIPIVDSQYTDIEDFTIQNFDKELMHGVVKYPTTPAPGEGGNTLIFGHTSQERWQKNIYGTIFSEIPKLVNGETIQVVRNGNLYDYKIIDKIIVVPKKVNEKFLEYNSKGNYLTLMGCYPLGRTDKRIMIIAEQIK